LLPPLGDDKRYRVLEWLNFVSTELHKGCSPLFNQSIPENIKDEIFRPILKRKLSIADQHFHDHRFFMGEQFTLPDGYLFVILRWLAKLKIDINEWTHLPRFFQDMKAHPSVQQALKEEGLN
jgi:glutathione S-transferase